MKLSIITISYNVCDEILATLISVQRQSFRDFEYIIIDGGSDDGTLKVVGEHMECVDLIISEPDNGIYDAMNKGLKYCKGDFVLFLNAGDSLECDESLSIIFKADCTSSETLVGVAKIVGPQKTWFYPSRDLGKSDALSWFIKFPPNHQCTFFPRSFYCSNRFDLEFKIGADVDYIYRSIESTGLCFINSVVSNFQLGGVSNSPLSFSRAILQCRESIVISRRYRSTTMLGVAFICMKYGIKYLVGFVAAGKSYDYFLNFLMRFKS